MSTYDEVYANTGTDLEFYLPDIQAFDRRLLITEWFIFSSKIYRSGSVGTIDELFRDNITLGSAQSSLSNLQSNDTDGQWFYDSTNDVVYLRSDNTPVTHHTIEGGRSFSDLKTLALQKSAEFIRSYINKPIHKRLGVGIQGSSGRDYDDIIVKSNSLLACASIVRPYDQERADYLDSLAYNPEEKNGYLDLIKSGEISLWHDKSSRQNQGIVRRVSVNSNTTANISDLRGLATDDDFIKVIITNGGTLTRGSANSSVTYSVFVGDDTGLQVKEVVSDEPISGGYQQLAYGLELRFSYGLLTTNDTWEIEVSGMIPESGSPVKTYTIERR